MSFNALSNELLVEIIRHIDLTKDLANMSNTCKILSRVAEPFLYSTFTQTRRHSVAAFLRTVNTKPYLARLVKHFSARPSRIATPSLEAQLDLSILEGKSTVIWLRTFLSDALYGPQFCDCWLLQIFSLKNWNATIALLLVVFSESLESISFSDYATGDGFEYIDEVLEIMNIAQNISISQNRLSRLNHVGMHYSGIESVDFMPLSIHWLQLQSVKDFRGYGAFQDDQQSMEENDYSQIILPTISFSLESSNVDGEAMRNFLHCFHGLQKFEYHHSKAIRESHMSPHAIGIGLKNSAHCLEELTISNEPRVQARRWPMGHLYWPRDIFLCYKNLRY